MLRGVSSALNRHSASPKSLTLTAAAVGGLCLLGYARYIEPVRIHVRSIELALPVLPDGLSGCRIGFMSDLHLGGPGGNYEVARQALRALGEASPDIILLGGDYYDRGFENGREPDWSELVDTAPTFAVLGNHDHKLGPDEASRIVRLLESAGVQVLRNGSTSIPLPGGEIDLIGVDDPYSNRARLATIPCTQTAGYRPRILLAHAGMIADELQPGAADLILSGHTHGAQVRISPFAHAGPLDLFWWLDRIHGKRLSPYRQGMFRVNGNLLYVSNGVGVTSMKFRFLAPPEIVVFRLVRHHGNPGHYCDGAARYVLRERLDRGN